MINKYAEINLYEILDEASIEILIPIKNPDIEVTIPVNIIGKYCRATRDSPEEWPEAEAHDEGIAEQLYAELPIKLNEQDKAAFMEAAEPFIESARQLACEQALED